MLNINDTYLEKKIQQTSNMSSLVTESDTTNHLRDINSNNNINLINSLINSSCESNSSNSSNSSNLSNSSNSSNSKNKKEKNYKDIFCSSKLYFKYLSVIKSKLNNLNNITDENYQKIFIEHYDYCVNLFTEMNKEWFWISNNDTFKSYRNQKNNYNEIEEYKKKFVENFNILELICNYYGFQKWAEKRSVTKASTQNQLLKQVDKISY